MAKLRLTFLCVSLFFSMNYALGESTDERVGVTWGAVPIVKYTSDMGLTVGGFARRFDYGPNGKLPFETLWSISASAATNGPKLLSVGLESTQSAGKKLRWGAEIAGTLDTFHRYYGLGVQPYSSTRQDAGFYYFDRQSVSLDTFVRKSLVRGLDLRFGWMALAYRMSPNSADTLFAQDFGTSGQLGFYSKFQLGAVLERRDLEFTPSIGYYASTNLIFSPFFTGNQTSWFRFDLDLRYYYPLVYQRWLWVAVQFQYGFSTDGTPLFEKARLGGTTALRGYPINRFVTNNVASARIDLRSVILRPTIFELPFKFGIGIFLDNGIAGESISNMVSSGLKTGYGFTLFSSYFTDDFLGSADFGFSEEGMTFYLGLGHAF